MTCAHMSAIGKPPACVTGRATKAESSRVPKAQAGLRSFALLVQRPISPRTSCPTSTERLQWSTRRSSDRKRA
jgi:hypothetical protein